MRGCLGDNSPIYGDDMCDLPPSEVETRMLHLEAALRQIAKMKPEKVAAGFVTGPAALFAACQRIAREALSS